MSVPTDAPDEQAWAGYYRWNADRAVRDLLARALASHGAVERDAVAVDLGCGSGQETRALLDAGFAVTAVDVTPAAIEIVSAYPEAGSRLTPVLSPMQDADAPTRGPGVRRVRAAVLPARALRPDVVVGDRGRPAGRAARVSTSSVTVTSGRVRRA